MHLDPAGIVFIVAGLNGIIFRRAYARVAVVMRERTKVWTGTTTQRRQEIFGLILGLLAVGFGILFMLAEP